ncbi:MAG: IS1096 element passenger TnpR family protein [Ornithinimicrobium sp.]
MPQDPTAALVRELGDALEDAVEGADPLGAEATAASVLGQMQREAGAPGSLELLPLAELIDWCVCNPSSQALAVVLALSEILPDAELRARASDAAERLSSVVDPPPWAAGLGQARLVDCWQMTDVFGDQANVLCSFDRGSLANGRRHGLMLLLDSNGPGRWMKDLFVVDDVDEALEQLRSAAAESEPITRLVQVGPEQVRGLLLPPLMASVESGPEDFYDVPSEDVQNLWPLAVARLRDLPETAHAPEQLSAEQVESLMTEFLNSEEAKDTDLDNASLRRWAEVIARYGNEQDAGKPLRVGPGKTLVLALESDVEDDETEPLARVLLAWNEWAARREGLPEEAVAALLFGVEMMLEEVFAEPEGDEDLEEDEELQQLSTALQGSADSKSADVEARRRFAMPHRDVVIDGERYTDLDPDDPDELELLVIGEHPEYGHVLDDPTSEELVDDVNPRLHIALLTIVITRLWTGEPMSTWREAKKMLATGRERQEILDALTVPVAEEIEAALSPELGLAGARGAARHTGKRRRHGPGRAPEEGEPTALQVRVDIAGARPPIWRRLVLPATMTLDELHLTLQLAFEWTDSHLHAFRPDRRDARGRRERNLADESAIRVGELLTGAGDRLEYEYDFGDSWVHQIVVEETVADGGTVRCLGGRRAGPPEDCGGVFFYTDLVEAWGHPEHPAYGEAAEMLEGNPASFDREMIDDRLRRVPVE